MEKDIVRESFPDSIHYATIHAHLRDINILTDRITPSKNVAIFVATLSRLSGEDPPLNIGDIRLLIPIADLGILHAITALCGGSLGQAEEVVVRASVWKNSDDEIFIHSIERGDTYLEVELAWEKLSLDLAEFDPQA